jgi:hypothetical protein
MRDGWDKKLAEDFTFIHKYDGVLECWSIGLRLVEPTPQRE